MGTNYYLNIKECDKCKRGDKIHIGKGSVGWKFLFYIPLGEYEPLYKTITELKKLTKKWTIYDEYNEQISYKDFWKLVESKQNLKGHDDYAGEVINGYDFVTHEFS